MRNRCTYAIGGIPVAVTNRRLNVRSDSDPGEYQFTPPFNFAAQPSWGQVTPFIIQLHEHALEGPQRLASRAYARDLAYIKAIGERTSTIRTPEQSEVAEF
jgi:hypothetical protein